MSLFSKITAQSKLDNDLMLQNEKIGMASRPTFENIVIPFNTQDEDLIKEYNAQFPVGFDSGEKDSNGNPVFRQYLMPQDKPDLVEPDLKEEMSEKELNDYDFQKRNTARFIDLTNKQILRIDRAYRQAMEDMNTGAKKFSLPVLEVYRTELMKFYNENNDHELFLEELDKDLKENEEAVAENKKNKIIAEQKNADLIKGYKEELSLLNSRAFTTEQLPSENQQDYYTRLQQNAEIDEPQTRLYNAQILTAERFKKSMKELERDNAKVEQVCNSLNAEEKLILLKRWALVKGKYIKVFGENNKHIVANDILEFFAIFLNQFTPIIQNNIEEGLHYATHKSSKTEDAELTREQQNYKDLFDIRLARRRELYHQHKNERIHNLANPAQAYAIDEEAQSKEERLPLKETKEGVGIIKENIPEKVKFGKLILNLHKLYYRNILCVKQHNGISIIGFTNTKISEKFVRLIMNLLEKIQPTINELHNLSTGEKQLYDRLIFLAHLNKMLPHTQDKTVHDLKKKMTLIEGEIGAGNDNKDLLKQLYKICHTLKDFGVLTPKDIKAYLKQFSS